MKNNYFAVNIAEGDKYYAYVIKVPESGNVLEALQSVKGIMNAMCYPKKRAEDIVRFWNQGYKENGTYLFADGPWE